MGYQCMFDDGQEGSLLVTNLDAGDTLAVCSAHWADWAAGFLSAVTGQTWEPVGEAVPHPETDEPSDEDEAADGQPPAAPAPETEAPASGSEDDKGDGYEGDALTDPTADGGTGTYGEPITELAAPSP